VPQQLTMHWRSSLSFCFCPQGLRAEQIRSASGHAPAAVRSERSRRPLRPSGRPHARHVPHTSFCWRSALLRGRYGRPCARTSACLRGRPVVRRRPPRARAGRLTLAHSCTGHRCCVADSLRAAESESHTANSTGDYIDARRNQGNEANRRAIGQP
jgi:hypothetical protein